ncbi:hypothetical protein CDL15_Pgr013333 [Punica granatum]|uniref:glucan endo-1,3-beta-D-glucosidase n=1 Tax=Punica granatum TaxID=22663 RepID=A0A218WPL9_PUNGR|nr:hypothetical protein CDL15_Pgr013333 [Punica granatum]
MAFIQGVIIMLVLASAHNGISIVEAQLDPGVCYGRQGSNLPPASKVVAMYKQYGIRNMRLFDPDLDVLTALKGQQIQVTLGVHNQDLPKLVVIDAAKSWYNTYVQNFPDVPIRLIAVGNEVIPGEFSQYVLPVMQNFQTIISSSNGTVIGVTTVVSMDTMSATYPPSSGAFKAEASSVMTGLLSFLASHNYPLLLNAYPYFPYAANPGDVSLAYAQFTAPGPVVHDGGLDYWNLLDAMVDSVYAAMEKVGVPNVAILISESGWPSAGNGDFTTAGLAATYNQNLLKKFSSQTGTPRRPSNKLTGYIFAMFNEDLKPTGIEQHWGLFYPDGTPVYRVFG